MACIIDQTSNSSSDICWARGDSDPKGFIVLDGSGNPLDITGFTFTMTVDSLKNPPDNTTNIFSLTGTITSGTDGAVEFAPSITDTDIDPDTYFYDIQQVNLVAEKKTIVKGKALIVQDISKV